MLDETNKTLTDQNKQLLSQIRNKDLIYGKLHSEKVNNDNSKMDLQKEKELLSKQLQECKKNLELSETLINDYKVNSDIQDSYVF